MARIPYNKPHLPYSSQITQLKSRGIRIDDELKAHHILEQVSYFRLSGYWYPMLKAPKENHIFKENASFETAFKIYCFDRELRSLITSELEKIEISVRARMIYFLWEKHGAFWFNDNSLFENLEKHSKTLTNLQREFRRSDQDFIRNFNAKYSDPLPPSCMILEIASFGNLSNLFSNLKRRGNRDKRDISNFYGLNETTFESWLHTFTYVRNICAHYSRLWNKQLAISPNIPRRPSAPFLENVNITLSTEEIILNNNSVYFVMSMIIYILNTINPNHSFKFRLINLLKKYPMVDVKAMGFPDNWKNEQIWSM